MKDFFKDENECVYKKETINSPSGRYQLLIRYYSTKPGCWSYSRGTVYRLYPVEKEICDIKRNYSYFHHSWINKNNQEWLISGRSYLNQVAVNLDTGEIFENGDGKDRFGFCWTKCFPSPDSNMLVIDGCYWACPYEYKFFDFTDPSKGWPELEVESPIYAGGGKDPIWVDENTIKCFQCHEIYAPLNKTADDLTNEEWNHIDNNDDNWVWIVDATITLQRQNNKMVIIGEEVTEEEKQRREQQKEYEAHWNELVKKFYAENELYLTLREYADKFNIKWDERVGFSGGENNRRFVVWFRESRKWFHSLPLLKMFKIRSVDLEWADNQPIRVRLWDKTGHQYQDVEFESNKEGMINAVRLVKKHTKRFVWF